MEPELDASKVPTVVFAMHCSAGCAVLHDRTLTGCRTLLQCSALLRPCALASKLIQVEERCVWDAYFSDRLDWLDSAWPGVKTSWDQRGNNADLDDYWVRY